MVLKCWRTCCWKSSNIPSYVFLFWVGSVFHTDQDDPSSSDDEGMPYTRPAKFKAAHSLKGPFDFDQIKVVQDLSGEHMVRGSQFFVVKVYEKQ